MDRPIFIISPGRSGSSWTAKQFADAGVWHGMCRAPDKNNPMGYYENVKLKQCLIKLHGRDWLKPFPNEHPEWADEATAIIRSQGYTGGPWLFKVGAVYWKCMRSFNPVYVKVWRPREKILASYHRLGWLNSGQNRYTESEIEQIIDRQHEAMGKIDGMDVQIP